MTEGRRIGQVWMLALATLALAVLGFAQDARASQTLYVSGGSSDDVAAFQIGADGRLSAVAGSPFAAGDGPAGVSVSPHGRNLYVSNEGDESISAFGVDSAGGRLSTLPGSPFATGRAPVDLAGTPGGGFLYVGNFLSDSISAFAVDGAGGALSSAGGSPFRSAAGPIGIAVSPSGSHVYAANSTAGQLSAYRVTADGSLAAVAGSPFVAPGGPIDVALSPDGRRLYTAAFTAGIHAFDVNPATGALSPVAGSPYPAGSGTKGVAISPDGRHLYATNTLSGDVSAYTIGAGGSLGPVPGSPFEAEDGPAGATLTPDGRYLYVSNSLSNDISAYAVGSGGALRPVAGSPFRARVSSPGSESLAVSPNQAPVAEFSFDPAAPNNATSFDASASHDPDGNIVRYDWDFGDGGKLADGGPQPTYVYRSFGTYDITLTVTDDGGCSTTLVSTGETIHCNGGARASNARQIELEEPRLEVLSRGVQRFSRAIRVVGKCDEACDVIARGTLIVRAPLRNRKRLGGERRRLRVKKRRAYALRPGRASVAPGERGVLRLRYGRKVRRAAARALRLGGSVKANITVDASDELGITARNPKTTEVRLKPRARRGKAKRRFR